MDAGGLVEGVVGDLDALLAVGFEPGDVGEAAELIRGVESLARRVHAVQVGLVAGIDRSGVHRDDGHSSAKVMVRHVAQLSEGEATRRAQSAAVMGDLPEVAAAHRSGELGSCQVRRLGRLYANRRVRAVMPISEAHFLAWAREGSFREFDALVGGWERLVDEDGTADGAARAQARRDVTWLQNHDGSWSLHGVSPSVDGAHIDDILGHFTDLEWHRDWAQARARLGDAATASDLARTHAQRRHDAFLAMAHQAAGTAPGVGCGSAGIVTNIVIDQHSFDRQLTRLAGADPGPVDPNDPTVRCSTLDGGPVDPTAATLTALMGELRRVVIGADSTVIDLRRRRLFTGAATLAVRLAHRECLWPGCHVPVSDCHIDHLHPWSQGGVTRPDNGAPACGRHNRHKHTHGWHTWRDTQRRWHLRRPDGTTIQGPHRPDPPGGTGPPDDVGPHARGSPGDADRSAQGGLAAG